MAQAPYLTSVVKVEQKDLAKLAARATPAGEDPRRIEISGKCPRCPHEIRHELAHREWGLTDGGGANGGGGELTITKTTDGVIEQIPGVDEILAVLRRRFRDDGPHEREVALQCNCGIEHKAGKSGCGAWFGLKLRWQRQPDGSVEVALAQTDRPITQLEIARAQARDAREATQLNRLRGVGGKLSAGLLAIAALIPAFVILKGVENVKDLPADRERVVQGLLGFAFVGIAGAAAAFLRIGSGQLGLSESTDDPTAARDRELQFASTLLRFAIGAFVVGVACLAAAQAITMFSEAEEDPVPGQITVTLRGGAAVCGAYVRTVTDPPSVRVKRADGSTSTFPIAEVEKLEFSTKC